MTSCKQKRKFRSYQRLNFFFLPRSKKFIEIFAKNFSNDLSENGQHFRYKEPKAPQEAFLFDFTLKNLVIILEIFLKRKDLLKIVKTV